MCRSEISEERMRKMVNVKIPPVTSIETAIRLYYEKMELGNKELKELFGEMANSTAYKLKCVAREQMALDDTNSWQSHAVNTESAYKSWGLNITDLERRWKKLNQLHLMKEGAK